MAGEAIVLDATTEDSANAELALSTSNGYYLLSHAYPPPARETNWVSSADTEGELVGGFRYRNREIPVDLRVIGSSQADIAAKIQALQEKVAKLVAEKGTYKRTLPSGEVIVFDIEDVEADALFDNRFIHKFRTQVSLRFICRPFGRGASSLKADHVETTLPCLIFEEEDLKGDVPGLGKLVVDEDSGEDQWFLVWGVQSRHYDDADTALLFYEAEELTPLGVSTANPGMPGASGAGTDKTIRNGILSPTPKAIMSTQIVASGDDLTHVGRFQVWTRIQCPDTNEGGSVVSLEWGEGDLLQVTRNADVPLYPADGSELSWNGSWRMVNLGQIDIPDGAQRWEGRILARSTEPGDNIHIDWLMFVPVDEGYAELRATPQITVPSEHVARDEFRQTAGDLTGQTAAEGGVWAGAGDADDFVINDEVRYAQRIALLDADENTGRFAISGVTAFAVQGVQIDLKSSMRPTSNVNYGWLGVVLRYIDVDNWLMATLRLGSRSDWLIVRKAVAGTVTELGRYDVPFSKGIFYRLRATVDAGGRWFVWYGLRNALDLGGPKGSGQEVDLATGGDLESGKPGFYDCWQHLSFATRSYDNFAAYVPIGDAVMFANQSCELRHDSAIREDATGSFWVPMTPDGSYLTTPPAGRDDRTLRMIVKTSRNNPDTGPDLDPGDEISARLTHVPRYLQVPEP